MAAWKKNDHNTTIAELKQRLMEFRDARDWKQFHTPKDLALAIAIEAGELGERFLWKSVEEINADLQDPKKREAVQEELADVVSYAFALANILNVDIASACVAKTAKNEAKYPVEKAKGSSKKYTEL